MTYTNADLLADLTDARAIRDAADYALSRATGAAIEPLERVLIAAENLIYELLAECRWREENLRNWNWL